MNRLRTVEPNGWRIWIACTFVYTLGFISGWHWRENFVNLKTVCASSVVKR